MKETVLLMISVLSVMGVFLLPSMPQDLLYHEFADQKAMLGMANFSNVVSNIPYVVIGIAGLRLLSSDRKVELIESIRFIYRLFYTAVLLVGLGSGYYHLSPDNSTLLWDRLPMAVAFMSFFTIVLAEFMREKLALILFPLLLFLGLASVIYWYWSESIGLGDLRLYLLIQFLPVLLMPVIFLAYSSRFTKAYFFWLVLLCYGLAKGFEQFDFEVLKLTGAISGHTLKHLVSAVGPVLLYLALIQRKRI